MIIAMILQRPLVAGLIVLVVWLAIDRAWFSRTGISKFIQRRRLEPKLRARLDVNPHDRDVRFQLAELLASRGRHDDALELIEQNLRAGDDNDETLFVAGVAAFGASKAGAADQAEEYLTRARDKSPTFRSGAIHLALGRGRLAHGHFADAEAALLDAIDAQPGSVEAHVLLARALAGQNKTEASAEAKAKAWKRYTEAPRFKRRQVRTWAWRANPIAAVRYFGVVVAVVAAVVLVVPRLVSPLSLPFGVPLDSEFDGEFVVDGFNVDVSSPPPASRFELVKGHQGDGIGSLTARWDLNRNGTVDLERKLLIGDLWCRIRTHYPDLPPVPPAQLDVVDSETGQSFGVQPIMRAYQTGNAELSTIHAFEALLESTTPADCTFSVQYAGHTMAGGVRDGVAYDAPPQ